MVRTKWDELENKEFASIVFGHFWDLRRNIQNIAIMVALALAMSVGSFIGIIYLIEKSS